MPQGNRDCERWIQVTLTLLCCDRAGERRRARAKDGIQRTDRLFRKASDAGRGKAGKRGAPRGKNAGPVASDRMRCFLLRHEVEQAAEAGNAVSFGIQTTGPGDRNAKPGALAALVEQPPKPVARQALRGVKCDEVRRPGVDSNVGPFCCAPHPDRCPGASSVARHRPPGLSSSFPAGARPRPRR